MMNEHVNEEALKPSGSPDRELMPKSLAVYWKFIDNTSKAVSMAVCGVEFALCLNGSDLGIEDMVVRSDLHSQISPRNAESWKSRV
ncbi:MAG: hypothetical protein NTY19_27860 [Planctomycetota bacterium]|nr:hypothetical protein [Planctomycetota bacterium]